MSFVFEKLRLANKLSPGGFDSALPYYYMRGNWRETESTHRINNSSSIRQQIYRTKQLGC